jgi:hypothetical protein
MRIPIPPTLLLAATLWIPQPAPAQDGNILLPVALIEERLSSHPFEIVNRQDTRFEGDRTQRVLLVFPPDSTPMMVKWATSVPGGEKFNNVPRYELAAYQLQKLFLDEADFVVPPTVARAVSLDGYRVHVPAAEPTFPGTSSVLVVLQYWLFDVTGKDVYDAERLQRDTAYARHFGNLNVLTYLIRHSDANQGNVLIAQNPARPRLFSVDNGVAFGSEPSDRGLAWRSLRTQRLPAATVERLRQIRREDLDRALGVVAQFEIRGGELVPVEPTAALSRRVGVRQREGVLQLGLTGMEIGQLHARLERLLKLVDSGRIATFE